ncbi:MAG: ABC transporter permease [Spirochaetaceae bacterium]|jgi:lipoprotein-releasing system permease protein|nr:ABC transporter permease [Spirochaetaceae bacterium]
MGWVGFAAGRLAAKKRGAPMPVLSILGIAVGVLALTVIISVMNGFQLGFIESILEISSYYIRLEFPAPIDLSGSAPAGDPSGEDRLIIEKIKNIPNVRAAVPFRELQALIRGGWGQHAVLIRGLYPNACVEDPGMAERLIFEEGSFDLEDSDSILLGAELAARLRVGLYDTVQIISVNGTSSFAAVLPGFSNAGGASQADDSDEPADESLFTIRGIFRSGFYEYDLGWSFINFEKAGKLGGSAYTLGVKLNDRWQDKKLAAQIANLAGNAKIQTWRDFNRAFFGALRTEKLFMFVLVGLIFIVVGLNIYQAQRRIVLERREEIGLLRAVGAGDRAVRLVFVWDGLVIGLTGAGTGTALGLLVSLNIAAFFALLEKAVNGILFLFNRGGGFAVFSPAVFYIKELKARVIPLEVLLIFLFGLLSALGAAWFASGKVSRIRPAEVLRYE